MFASAVRRRRHLPMTIQEATYFLLNNLRSIYADGEASQITDWVMESLTGSKKAERMIYKNSAITKKEEAHLQEYSDRLLKHEPVQYVLQEAWFCGLKFYVDKNVLIPRPETEELVEWIVKEIRNQNPEIRRPEDTMSILDIGTGSGCIPISLKRKLQSSEMWSCDISEGALGVAKRNADTFGTEVNFLPLDFLRVDERNKLSSFDIIVSNPPYVPQSDKLQMRPNVLEFEPHIALFVPDNDALIFYKAIAEFGKTHLNRAGKIYVEIYENPGEAILDLFNASGYKTEIKKDLQGKERMLKATT